MRDTILWLLDSGWLGIIGGGTTIICWGLLLALEVVETHNRPGDDDDVP